MFFTRFFQSPDVMLFALAGSLFMMYTQGVIVAIGERRLNELLVVEPEKVFDRNSSIPSPTIRGMLPYLSERTLPRKRATVAEI